MGLLTEATVPFTGQSTKPYDFKIYATDTEFKETWGGIYAFTNRTKNNDGVFNHTVIYVGKAVKFNQRFDNHEKWDLIKNAGANCLCIYKVDEESDMLKIEEDLIKGLKPQLNVVHKS